MTSEILEECVAHVLGADRTARRLTRGVLRLQRKLHQEVDDRAWRTYMQLEAMVNQRHDELLRRVVGHLTGGITG